MVAADCFGVVLVNGVFGSGHLRALFSLYLTQPVSCHVLSAFLLFPNARSFPFFRQVLLILFLEF